MSITINPSLTSNAAGTFGTSWNGLMQGTALNQPAVIFSLAGGVLKSNATLPMWGGVAISEYVPGVTPGPAPELGGNLDRATNLTANTDGTITGFSVFDQNYSSINSPQSPVPLAAPGMQVNFYRLGSGARVAVKCAASLAAYAGDSITKKVSWDFTHQMLTPYASTTISSATYDNATGEVEAVTAAPHGLEPGDHFILSSATGTGSFADLNGEHVATAGTTGTALNFTAADGLTLTLTGGNIGTGAILPVRVLDVQIGNSMTVDYDADTGFATWNRSGNAAVILI